MGSAICDPFSHHCLNLFCDHHAPMDLFFKVQQRILSVYVQGRGYHFSDFAFVCALTANPPQSHSKPQSLSSACGPTVFM